MRKTIADRLVKSATEAPHFFLSVDCDISEINKIRKMLIKVTQIFQLMIL